MNKKRSRVLAALLALIMCIGVFTACQPKTTTPETTEATVAPAETAAAEAVPLVVAEGEFSEKFSPFFADTVYDVNAMEMTQVPMLTTDRMGGIVYNAIEGETIPYNGTDYTYTGPCDVSVKYDEAADITTYTIKLADNIKFSDGTVADADDIIFTFYVFADPSYVGSTTLGSYNIIGLKNYQTQTSDDVYTKYMDMAVAIRAAGADHAWAAADAWTQEQQTAYWDLEKAAWIGDVQDIVNYVVANYASYVADLGKTEADLAASDQLNVALGMYVWGFAAPGDGGTLVGGTTGTSWDLTTTFPTIEDLYAEAYAKYAGDAEAFFGVEAADTAATGTVAQAQADFISAQAKVDPAMAGGIPNIEGIKKIDQSTVEVKTKGYEAPAVYTIGGLYLTPLHYYGDEAQYDYANNKFGHPFGDLSIAQSKTTQPMGIGPYKFIKYENRICYFEANENYFKGEPKTKYVQFKETIDSEVVAATATGTVDVGDLNGSKKNFEEIAGYNSNGEITGDKIATTKVDNLGYGYIGMNADNILVGTDPASTESKDLRKAIATVLAVYRDAAYDSYYGEAASVVNYPISNTSWAAPQPTDEGYKVAFSTDVDGNDIYNSNMTQDEKYAAALQAAIGYFKAAGFTYDEATGKLTAAPAGAKLSYEAVVGGDGIGDHPSFAVLTDAAAAFATIGFELKINDLTDTSVLWDMLDAGSQEIWCAAWQAVIDPDMYQVYHSSGIIGRGGSDSNHYHIDDATLDQLIIDARKSDDQSYRKAIYRQALDLIADWAVEIPAYQRQNCTVFSSERVKMDTVTPDITTFWSWLKGIELVEMQ
ncbi:MAG: ABC transporter substrate-binding protein [Eubacteriales bacterium]|nr:ABC transporter substrate-binding protein [Eubacteriales bacterium]